MQNDSDSTPCRHYRDYLDLCCEMLSDENAALRDELRETQIDRDSYRALAQETLHALADLHGRHVKQTARLREFMGIVDRWHVRHDDPERVDRRDHEAAA
jgi:hypothetical protein